MSEDGGGKKYKNKMLPLAAGCIAGGVEATAVWPVSEFSLFILNALVLDGYFQHAKRRPPYLINLFSRTNITFKFQRWNTSKHSFSYNPGLRVLPYHTRV